MDQQPSLATTSTGYTRAVFRTTENDGYGWMLDQNLFSQQSELDSVVSIHSARDFVLQMPEATKNMLLAPIKEGILDPQSVIRIKNFSTQESVAIRVKDFFQIVTSPETEISPSLPPTPERLRKAAALIEKDGGYASICTQSTYSSIKDSESVDYFPKQLSAKADPPSIPIETGSAHAKFSRHLCAIASRHKELIATIAIIVVMTLFIAIPVVVILRSDWREPETNNSSSTTQTESTLTTPRETSSAETTLVTTEATLSETSTTKTTPSVTSTAQTSLTIIITSISTPITSSTTTPTSTSIISTTDHQPASSSVNTSSKEQPCTSIGTDQRICLTARSTPLKHNSGSVGATATVAYSTISDGPGGILLLAWQDPVATEIYLSTLSTNNDNLLIWSKKDQKLNFPATNISDTCAHEHICTIVGIHQRCMETNCTEMNMTQYCCTCGQPTNGIICSKPDAPFNFDFAQRRPIGQAWTNAVGLYYDIYFASAAIESSNLADFLLIKMKGKATERYSLAQIPKCLGTDSCTILGMIVALNEYDGWYFGSPQSFGAVFRTSTNETFFCEFLTFGGNFEMSLEWCTESTIPIHSDANRIAIASKLGPDENYIWYLVEIKAENNDHHFVIYLITSSYSVEYSAPIDFIDNQYSDFKTCVAGLLFDENSLYIVLQSSTMEHLVAKYEISEREK